MIAFKYSIIDFFKNLIEMLIVDQTEIQ